MRIASIWTSSQIWPGVLTSCHRSMTCNWRWLMKLDEFLSTRQVESLTDLSGPAITKLIQAGKFPQPIRIGSTYVHQREAVLAWLRTRPRVRRGGRLEYRHREMSVA